MILGRFLNDFGALVGWIWDEFGSICGLFWDDFMMVFGRLFDEIGVIWGRFYFIFRENVSGFFFGALHSRTESGTDCSKVQIVTPEI